MFSWSVAGLHASATVTMCGDRATGTRMFLTLLKLDINIYRYTIDGQKCQHNLNPDLCTSFCRHCQSVMVAYKASAWYSGAFARCQLSDLRDFTGASFWSQLQSDPGRSRPMLNALDNPIDLKVWNDVLPPWHAQLCCKCLWRGWDFGIAGCSSKTLSREPAGSIMSHIYSCQLGAFCL